MGYTPLWQVTSFAKSVVRDARGSRGRGPWPGRRRFPFSFPPRPPAPSFSQTLLAVKQSSPQTSASQFLLPSVSSPMQHCSAECCSAPWGRAGRRQRRGVPGTRTCSAGERCQRSGSRAQHTQDGSLRAFFLLFSYLDFIFYLLLFICCLLVAVPSGLSALGVCDGVVRPSAFRYLPEPSQAPYFARCSHPRCGSHRAGVCDGKRMQGRVTAAPARTADARV